MSYKLADGSMSTDYDIGDEFQLTNSNRTFVFTEDDGSKCPWFRQVGKEDEYARHWQDLTPLKVKKNSDLINQLRETIKQLNVMIEELKS